MGLKPAKLYVRLSIIPFSDQSTYVSSGIKRHYVIAFVYLHFALPDTSVFNLYEELCITRVDAIDSFVRVLNPCFVVSQLFSVVRHVGRFKLGLKPAQD